MYVLDKQCFQYLNEVHVFEFPEDLPPGLPLFKHGAEVEQNVFRRVFFPHLLKLPIHPFELLLILLYNLKFDLLCFIQLQLQ